MKSNVGNIKGFNIFVGEYKCVELMMVKLRSDKVFLIFVNNHRGLGAQARYILNPFSYRDGKLLSAKPKNKTI